jgi:hypothetical protein
VRAGHGAGKPTSADLGVGGPVRVSGECTGDGVGEAEFSPDPQRGIGSGSGVLPGIKNRDLPVVRRARNPAARPPPKAVGQENPVGWTLAKHVRDSPPSSSETKSYNYCRSRRIALCRACATAPGRLLRYLLGRSSRSPQRSLFRGNRARASYARAVLGRNARPFSPRLSR